MIDLLYGHLEYLVALASEYDQGMSGIMTIYGIAIIRLTLGA